MRCHRGMVPLVRCSGSGVWLIRIRLISFRVVLRDYLVAGQW
jgi:hypothetical protein